MKVFSGVLFSQKLVRLPDRPRLPVFTIVRGGALLQDGRDPAVTMGGLTWSGLNTSVDAIPTTESWLRCHSNKTGLQPVSRPVEQVYYFEGWGVGAK